MDAINPLLSIPPVGSSTSQERGGRQSGGNLPGQGQLLRAIVLQAKSDTLFSLDIDGNRLTAKSEAPLQVGQQLQLQVLKTTPQIEFKIVSDTLNQFIGRSITLVGKNIDLTSLFQNLQTQSPPLLHSLTPSSKSVIEFFHTQQQSLLGSKDSGAILKHLIENLGLNLEQLLAKGDQQRSVNTLKAALLEIAHTFTNAEKLTESTNKLLTILELFQVAQLHRSGESHLIFPIPLPFVEHGFLIVERDNDGQSGKTGEDDESRFSLHLKMSELGNLRIEFLQEKENLAIKFMTDSEEKAEFIKAFQEELTDSITNAVQIQINFSSDAPDPIANMIREMIPQGSSVLDTKV